MSKRTFRIALAVVIGSLVIVLGIAGYFISRALAYPDACPDGTSKVDTASSYECKADSGAPKEIEVEIKSGMSFPAIASLLSQKGLIERPSWFRLFAMWHGKTTEVKTGKYVIKNNLSPRQILDVLVAGVKEVTVKVTLPEGKHMLEIFDLLAAARVADRAELEKLARDRELLSNHAITGDSVEGYLFPDTYEFRLNEKPRVVIERLIARHQEVWQELIAKHPRDTAKLKEQLKWGDREILIMASIVEKEAVEPKERPRIAQVFINRLTSPSFKSRRLETDPTIRYGCEVPVVKSTPCKAWNQADRLHTAQLRDADNPYNTYEHSGLPPGPISNPGRGAMEATIAPDGSDFLYFVAKDARNHVFARTYEEHKKNVDKYQR